MSWETVEQSPSRGGAAGQVTHMRLAMLKSQTVLWVTFPLAFLREAGFKLDGALGLQYGTGKNADWLRVMPQAQGRRLRTLGRSKSHVMVLFNAPPAWHGFHCESTDIQPQIDTATGAILLPVPWDFSEITDQQEMAA